MRACDSSKAVSGKTKEGFLIGIERQYGIGLLECRVGIGSQGSSVGYSSTSRSGFNLK